MREEAAAAAAAFLLVALLSGPAEAISPNRLAQSVNVTEDPTLPNCFLFTGTYNTSGWDQDYAVGETAPSPVCIMLGDANSTDPLDFPMKMIFYPKVDQYTLLEMTSSENSTGAGLSSWAVDYLLEGRSGSGVTSLGWVDVKARVQVGTLLSQQRQFTWGGPGNARNFAAFLTILIGMDAGFIDDLVWDDGCSGCSEVLCGTGTSETCGINYPDCDTGGLSCNPKVYVAWTGTDRKGEFAISSGMVWSRFRSYSINTIYANAARTSTDPIPRV